MTVDGIHYVVDRTDNGPGEALFVWRVLPEFTVLRRALGLLAEHGEDPAGRVLVDVGANIGTTCLPAVTRHGFARAIAIEPYHRNVATLRANVGLNDLGDRVDVVEAAASTEEGEAAFAVGKTTRGARHRSGAGALREDGGEAVRVVTVDAELGRRGISPGGVGLLWADVQGHEAKVALGARALLDASRPFVFAARTNKLVKEGDLETLATLVETSYAHVIDLRDPASRTRAASSLRDLLRPGMITDILAFGSAQRGSA